ncbi:MAG: magnesium and cobalt transport protein CorA [Chthoniobacterales bacterium]|nr:MAG: magnesium and cobalt transport protein CorA [Chthoniobacterales bacterium]
MFKTRNPIPGESPGTLRPREELERRPPVITLIEYDRGYLEERVINEKEELLPHLDNQRVTWINIDGLGDIDVLRALGSRFNLHPLALEDVLDTSQRPKVEQYDNYLFIVAHMLYLDHGKAICGEQVSMFLGKNFLITLQEEAEFDVFEPVRARIRAANGTIRKMGPDYLAYALLDSIIDYYYPVLEAVGAKIELIEDHLVDVPRTNPIGELHGHKRALSQIRRFIWPVRDLVNFLIHEESGIITKGTKVYLRDCYDHTVQLMDLVESYRDVLSGLMDLYLSAVGIRTNEIMRVLTVISSVFIPLTFIAGVYGMNFAREVDGKRLPWNMPELYSPYGYIGCLLFMLAVAIFQIVYFKKRRWL